MKTRLFYFMVFFSIILVSCSDTQEEDIDIACSSCDTNFSQANDSLENHTKNRQSIREIIKEIDTGLLIKKKILFIPKASCHGCLDYTFKMCHKFCKIEKLGIVYIGNYLPKRMSCKSCIILSKPGMIDTKLKINGITLLTFANDKQINYNYITAKNIKLEYKSLLIES